MMAEFRDEINCGKPRRSYLITYSQADLSKFPTRESFAAAICEVFTSERSKFRPQHWACCLENHADQGFHCHMTLKLTGPKKWLECKRAQQLGILLLLSKIARAHFLNLIFFLRTMKTRILR